MRLPGRFILTLGFLLALHAAATEVVLEAATAKVAPPARYEPTTRNIGYWSSMASRPAWMVNIASAGTYRVRITYACQNGSEGATYDVLVGNQKANGTIQATGTGWQSYVEADLGPVILRKTGEIKVEVVAKSKSAGAVMNLRKITLVKEDR